MTDGKRDTLPLLITFKALMDHGGVVAAARALDLSQSAVSKHLARLRTVYGDPLFVRTADGMRPTPRALTMVAQVDDILRQVDQLTHSAPFDPARLTGEFVLSTTDDVRCPLLPGLMRRLDRDAPDLRITFIPLAPDYSEQQLEAGTVDLVIGVNWHAPDRLKQRRLRQDRFVTLMSVHHPLAHTPMTAEAYAATRHVMVAPLGMRAGHIDEILADRGLSRFVRLSVPDFYQITPDILGHDHLTTLPERVAAYIADDFAAVADLVLRPLPFDVPHFGYYALWHDRYERDPRHIWMRGVVAELLRD